MKTRVSLKYFVSYLGYHLFQPKLVTSLQNPQEFFGSFFIDHDQTFLFVYLFF